MGMAAILDMWPGPFEHLASIGPVVSEEKMFENVDTHTYTYILTTEAYPSYKLTTEPSAQVS